MLHTKLVLSVQFLRLSCLGVFVGLYANCPASFDVCLLREHMSCEHNVFQQMITFTAAGRYGEPFGEEALTPRTTRQTT